MPTFDIIDDPWLDVLRTDGTVATLSLSELLTSAHGIARLSESSPLTEVALLRFLVALVSDGLREQIPTEEDWVSFVERCRSGFPDEAIDAILAPLEGRSDVLDPNHDGFFDGPEIRRVSGWDNPNALQSVSRVLPEIPTGTRLAHFVHPSDEASVLCLGCMLNGRAVEAAYARGGLGPSLSRNLLATIGGIEPRYVMAVGRTLLDTLLLNMVVGDEGRPSWRGIHRIRDGEPGPLARLTWRPRMIMPVAASEAHSPCVRCGSITHPRFSRIVMVDTYNHKDGRFGTKEDVDQWKKVHADPHLLPVTKGALNLGRHVDEWPLRALARMLNGETSTLLDTLARRAIALRGSITIMVASSAGNQAKIDDAPHAIVEVPLALLARSPEDRAVIAVELSRVFDKAHHGRRRVLIPDKVPDLLDVLAVANEPQAAVREWLRAEQPSKRYTADGAPTRRLNGSTQSDIAVGDDTQWEACTRLMGRLRRLPRSDLAALCPNRCGGPVADAARQKAFEGLWFRSSLPCGARRHALREALSTVAPIYAVFVHSDHLPARTGSFVDHLRAKLKLSGAMSARTDEAALLRKLIDRVTTGSSESRDLVLMQLVETLVKDEPDCRRHAIDFTDLMYDVARWADPQSPTPARWRRLLERHEYPLNAD